MNQTKLVSLIETVTNTSIGFAVTYVAWPVAAVLTGIEYSSGQQLAVVVFFTILSIARGYVVRRFFNAGLHMAAVKLATKVYKNES